MASLYSIFNRVSVNLRSKLTNSMSLQPQTTFYSSYKSSEFIEDLGPINVKYETTKDPEEWKFVERLLPPETVPEPIKKDSYPSGWKPQAEDVKNLPYFIQRTKNHMIPVYLDITRRGLRKITYIRYIEGDIWRFEQELKEFLQPQLFKPLKMQVNEFAKFIRVKGDFVNAIKYFLEKKNL